MAVGLSSAINRICIVIICFVATAIPLNYFMGHAFLIFVCSMLILFRCSFFFIWLDSEISKVSWMFDLILRLLGYLGFLCFDFLGTLFSSVQIYFQFLLVRVLLDSFFQGDLFGGGVSGGFSVFFLFAVYTFWGLLTVYMISSFPAALTYWRSGALFFVMPKFLAIVASQWVWNIGFNFCYLVANFYFSRWFWSVKI